MSLKHLFSLFYKDISEKEGAFVCDEQLSVRITKVLRLQNNEQLILFNESIHLLVSITIQKKGRYELVTAHVISASLNEVLTPTITLCPALLKKPAFEEVVYVATQMGITRIEPLLTTQVQREWGGEKERNRLQQISIAAAEQSRQFVLPILLDPEALETKKFVSAEIIKLYFEVGKLPTKNLVQHLIEQKPKSILVVFGPEGGLTDHEQQRLEEQGFIGYRLTPSVLRSTEAITVGLGILRSLMF